MVEADIFNRMVVAGNYSRQADRGRRPEAGVVRRQSQHDHRRQAGDGNGVGG